MQRRVFAPSVPNMVSRIVHHELTPVTLFADCSTSSGTLLHSVQFGIHCRLGECAKPQKADNELSRIAEAIFSFLSGEGIDLSWIQLDLQRFTSFQRSILSAARSIPRGSRVSYSQLAAMAGKPEAIRAAASVMRKNAFPIVVPCHRVIRSDGTLGGFMGRTENGREVELKKRLLELEGLAV